MKNRLLLKTLCVIALFSFSSCKEYFITTKINSNGTVERTVICNITADKANKHPYVPETFLMDSVWSIKPSRDTVKKNDVIKADIKFSTFDEAVQELKKPRRNFDSVIDINIEKHFKFFFTYYTYKETYKPFNLFKKTPIDKYFTKEEIAKLKEGSDSVWVKSKLDEYFYYNVIDTFLDIAGQKFRSEHQINFSNYLTFEKKKNIIAEWLYVINKDKDNRLTIELIKKYFDKVIAQKLTKFLKNDKVLEKIFNSMSRFDGKYENAVVMPGIITASNSKSIEGNKAIWKFDQKDFKFFEHEMSAESRVVNTWVIAVSAIVIILLIAGLMLPKLRKPHYS